MTESCYRSLQFFPCILQTCTIVWRATFFSVILIETIFYDLIRLYLHTTILYMKRPSLKDKRRSAWNDLIEFSVIVQMTLILFVHLRHLR